MNMVRRKLFASPLILFFPANKKYDLVRLFENQWTEIVKKYKDYPGNSPGPNFTYIEKRLDGFKQPWNLEYPPDHLRIITKNLSINVVWKMNDGRQKSIDLKKVSDNLVDTIKVCQTITSKYGMKFIEIV